MAPYRNFNELANNEEEGCDFVISYRHTDSGIAFLAPHGGGIEPGTFSIADALAGTEHSFYGFKGMKKSGNTILHITSKDFDEPIALRIAGQATMAISIHGCREANSIVFIGGRNLQLKKKILTALLHASFSAVISEIPGLQGNNPENICNRCTSGEGVQLEISRGLREEMFEGLAPGSIQRQTPIFETFIQAVRTAVQST